MRGARKRCGFGNLYAAGSNRLVRPSARFVNDVDEVTNYCAAYATNYRGLFYFDDQSFSGEFLKSIVADPVLTFSR